MIDLQAKLKQVCVYWEPDDFDEYGKMTFKEPVELECRWEDTNILYVDANGQEHTSRAIVYMISSTEITGWLQLGEIEDLPSEYDDPREIDHVFEIKMCKRIPSVNAENTLVEAYL